MIFFAVESLDVKKNRISLPVSFLVSRPLLRALISSPGASLLSLSNVCASESGASKEPSQALATEALTTISDFNGGANEGEKNARGRRMDLHFARPA